MNSEAAPIIRVEGLTIGWGTTVLQESATFDVRRGEVFAILGGSGCGKSTMLRYLIGLEVPLSGGITIDGEDVAVCTQGAPRFGMMFQDGALLGSLTVLENVALPLEQWTKLDVDAVDAIARAKLRLVGLDGAEDKLPSELSGGMRKRAAIARAMALEPQLLFLDEPSAGLDPITAVELDDLIETLRVTLNLTVVMVTHELPSIFKIVKSCILLDKPSRSIIARGDPNELKVRSPDARVKRFFNRESNSEVEQQERSSIGRSTSTWLPASTP